MAGRGMNGQWFGGRRGINRQGFGEGRGMHGQSFLTGRGLNGQEAMVGRDSNWQGGVGGYGWGGYGMQTPVHNRYGAPMYTTDGNCVAYDGTSVPPSFAPAFGSQVQTARTRKRHGRLGSKANWNFFEEQAKAQARAREEGPEGSDDEDETLKYRTSHAVTESQDSKGSDSGGVVLPQDEDDDEDSVVIDEKFSLDSLGLRNTSVASSAATFATQVSSGYRLHGEALAQVDGAVMSPSTDTTQSKTFALGHEKAVASTGSIRSGASEHNDFYTQEQQLLEQKQMREIAVQRAANRAKKGNTPSSDKRKDLVISRTPVAASRTQSSPTSSTAGEANGPSANISWLVKDYQSQIAKANGRIATQVYSLQQMRGQLGQQKALNLSLETELSQLREALNDTTVQFDQARDEITRLVNTFEDEHMRWDTVCEDYRVHVSTLEHKIEEMKMSQQKTDQYYGAFATPEHYPQGHYPQTHVATRYPGAQQFGDYGQDRGLPPPNVQHPSRVPTTPVNVMPNIEDDVFGKDTPTPTSKFPSSPAEFERKPYQDVLNCAFSKVEYIVRQVRLHNLRTSFPPPDVRRIIDAANTIINNYSHTIELLQKPGEKTSLIISIINYGIVERIFKQPVLTKYGSELNRQYLAAIQAEDNAITSEVTRQDYAHRLQLALNRATVVNRIIIQAGFWKWVRKYSNDVAREIVNKVRGALHADDVPAVNREVGRAVNDALRIAVRMSREPTQYLFSFIPCGIGYEGKTMVHRNEGLMGETVPSVRTPWSTSICLFPLVRSNDWSDSNKLPEIVHKAEVTLVPRRLNLRTIRWNRR